MAQKGKSKVWPYLVALNEALSKPLTSVSSGLIKLEETWEQIYHDKDTQQIKADVLAIREALADTPEDTLSTELGELAALTGLTVAELQSIVTRRARRLGLISDAERLSEYKRQLLARYEYADLAGITQMTTLVSVRLDDLFVPLAAAPESDVRAASEEEGALLEEMERTRDPEERARIEARLGEKGFRGFRRAAQGRAIPVPELLRREGKVVLLGDPGSGKTTLVKWLARQCAKGTEASAEALGCTRDLLPVVVPIARYGAALQEDAGVHVHEHIRGELSRNEGDGFGELVLKRAEQGGCLFLLDGLDEIPDPKWRLAAARGVSELLGRFSRCSFVVTSRIVGYSVCRVTGGVGHFVLEGFGDEDITRFARQWAEAYERASHTDAMNLDRARREADDLVEAIFDGDHPQIAEFARNPLLLTILALIKQKRVELPQRRVQLYEIALDTLMESWVRARSIGGPVRGIDLDTGESVRVWRRIAYWMHRERPTGTAHRTDLIRELKSVLYEEKGLEGQEAERTAAHYLSTVSERAVSCSRWVRTCLGSSTRHSRNTWQRCIWRAHRTARSKSWAPTCIIPVGGRWSCL